MKKTITLFTILITFLACQNGTQNNDNAAENNGDSAIYERLSVQDFQKKLSEMPDVQLVDVRTPEEYEAGKIAHAVNINFYDDTFKDELGKLNKEAPVLVYCAKGGRSKKAADMMVEMGFSEIYELEKGYSSWEQ